MKCQRCDKPATFHITELVKGGDPEELHLCEECAREYLTQENEPKETGPPSLAGVLASQLALGQTAEELERLDQQACPVCGITFYEFRNQGRLGCPHDYTCFEKEIEPLVVNIHGETEHCGKRPTKSAGDAQEQTRLIRLRRQMQEAIDEENYEQASELRDEIKRVESSGQD